MKVYIAGQYARRNEFRKYARLLNAAGIDVTSNWLNETNPLKTQMGDDTPEFYQATAALDLRDVKRADAVLFFAEDPLVGIPRGGRHVEFGYALGLHIPIYVIGPKENVFHYLMAPHYVRHFESVEDYLASVSRSKNLQSIRDAASAAVADDEFDKLIREYSAGIN